MAQKEGGEKQGITVYDAFEPKLAALHGKRFQPFNQAALSQVEDVKGLLGMLTGEMMLPEEIEGKMWMTIAGEIMEAQGQGIRIEGVEWTILDVLLAVANLTDEFPVLLLVEVMLASDEHVVKLRGRPVHAGQLYNMTYQGWSKMEDIQERARHHFKFGFLLLTIGEGARAADQLHHALRCNPDSGAKDLLPKLLQAEKGSVTTSAGVTITMEGTQILYNGKPDPKAVDASTTEAPADEDPSEADKPASSSGAAPAAAPAPTPAPTASASAAPSGKKLMRDEADDSSSSSLPFIAAGVAAVAVLGFVAYRVLGAKRD